MGNLVVQNRMVAEKELIDMTEALANDLGKSRQEVLSLRRQLENKQYLLYNDHSGAAGSVTMIQQQQPCSMTSDYCSSTERGSPIEPHKRSNHQQKASSGKTNPSLMLGVVEKQDSVAWMLHMPDSPKTITKWKKYNW